MYYLLQPGWDVVYFSVSVDPHSVFCPCFFGLGVRISYYFRDEACFMFIRFYVVFFTCVTGRPGTLQFGKPSLICPKWCKDRSAFSGSRHFCVFIILILVWILWLAGLGCHVNPLTVSKVHASQQHSGITVSNSATLLSESYCMRQRNSSFPVRRSRKMQICRSPWVVGRQQFHEYVSAKRVTEFFNHVYLKVLNTWFGYLIWELVKHKLRAGKYFVIRVGHLCNRSVH